MEEQCYYKETLAVTAQSFSPCKCENCNPGESSAPSSEEGKQVNNIPRFNFTDFCLPDP
jgi:hypothetical protein